MFTNCSVLLKFSVLIRKYKVMAISTIKGNIGWRQFLPFYLRSPMTIRMESSCCILKVFVSSASLILLDDMVCIKYLLLHVSEYFVELVEECHSLVLAGGTLSPVLLQCFIRVRLKISSSSCSIIAIQSLNLFTFRAIMSLMPLNSCLLFNYRTAQVQRL